MGRIVKRILPVSLKGVKLTNIESTDFTINRGCTFKRMNANFTFGQNLRNNIVALTVL